MQLLRLLLRLARVCDVTISKVGRCSDAGSIAADALSKAKFDMFYELMPEKKIDPAWVPRTILRWLEDPKEDLQLGHRIFLEMA